MFEFKKDWKCPKCGKRYDFTCNLRSECECGHEFFEFDPLPITHIQQTEVQNGNDRR